MIRVKIQSFDDLTQEEQGEVSNNGSGKEFAGYLRIIHNGETIRLESDAMEPEDAKFFRDLKWIKAALLTAYSLGCQDGPALKEAGELGELKNE